MLTQRALAWLYPINAVVLITHQIDAAYWHEWELFRIPGGNQVNLLLNLPILAIVFCGYRATIQGGTPGLKSQGLLAATGLLTVSLHSFFMVQGSPYFLQPVSIGLLVATFLLSVGQILVLLLSRGQ